jgi:hypothetical protein
MGSVLAELLSTDTIEAPGRRAKSNAWAMSFMRDCVLLARTP